ncbi:MAG: LytTR family transcriptional regulator DNA-binding domain-containing protein [Bacteroidales bacterium]|jgi:two-component system LytT family response regulator|nr:LytTR family transcriptional regulator DNA-binding domain-containing protein [Bacteroidales bacterium]
MNTIRCLIIDDEAPARQLIREYLQIHPDIYIEHECCDGFDGLKQINNLKPDLIFLDVQMPRLSGFEMLEVVEHQPVIIFTTAYDEYAIKAFEANASDYLLKPFSRQRLDQALEKALLAIRSKHNNPEIPFINHVPYQQEIKRRIVVKTRHQIKVLSTSDICCIAAEGDYVMIHTATEKFLKNFTMKAMEEQLDPSQFIRVHRSFLVNINCIKNLEQYQKESYVLVLSNGMTVSVSRTGLKNLKDNLKF